MRDLELTLGGHERFLELCALYPTGSLSEAELADLRQHLEACKNCRNLLAEYREFDRTLAPVLMGQEHQPDFSRPAWNQDQAKQRLFENLEGQEPGVRKQSPAGARFEIGKIAVSARALAAAVLAAIVLTGGISYFAGLRKGGQRSAQQATRPQGQANPTSGSPALAADQKELEARIKQRDAKIESLSAKIAEQSNQIARLKELLSQTADDDHETKSQLSAAQAQQTVSAGEHDALAAQLADAQAKLAVFQAQLRQTLDQRTSELMQTATLQRKIDDLNATVSDKDAQLERQRTLLSSDRDIRDLMGARDLFIADVFDIARDGTTKKPFGRVFYTKNKSLVFYAFDLDKQKDVRKTDVAFQAWGLSDVQKHNPTSLGVFYMDNQANRRWVLKFDDPAVLEQINAVFVTVEPPGGSTKPSGKQFLYAYLQAQPNHP